MINYDNLSAEDKDLVHKEILNRLVKINFPLCFGKEPDMIQDGSAYCDTFTATPLVDKDGKISWGISPNNMEKEN